MGNYEKGTQYGKQRLLEQRAVCGVQWDVSTPPPPEADKVWTLQ